MNTLTVIFAFLGIAAITEAQSNVVAQLINGIPQADQFAGSDMCDKLRNANNYAIANGISQVDATHFYGVQPCSLDPVQNLPLAPSGGSPIGLTINLGAVHIQTAKPWNITGSRLRLHGMEAGVTQLEYTGAITNPLAAGIIIVSAGSATGTSYVNGVEVSDIAIYGGNRNVADGVLLQAVHHSEFKNIVTWGLTGCGIHSNFAVTDTFYRPRTSVWNAIDLGINNSNHTTPAHGLCFDSGTGGATTDGTVTDAAAEGVTGVGWLLAFSTNMTFTSGTSEQNGAGVEIDKASTANTFINVDLESNTGDNVTDNGTSTVLINPTMDSRPTTLGSTSKGFTEIGGNETSVLSVNPAATESAWSFGSTDKLGRTINGVKLGPDTRPSITASVGAPPTSCVTGSIYMNVAGGAGNTMFVCQASGWVPK